MKIYARIVNGVVYELFQPGVMADGVTQWPIEESVTPDYLAQMVEVTGMQPMPDQHWTYDGEAFAPPVWDIPDPAEVNEGIRQNLMFQARVAMAPVLLSLNLGDATDEESEIAKEWQVYYRALRDFDVNSTNPTWPTAPATT